MAADTARIAFPGGRLIISCATPYDRQLLAEYVVASAPDQQPLQMSVHDAHWRVESADRAESVVCAGCGKSSHRAVCRISSRSPVYCVACAVSARACPTEAWRRPAPQDADADVPRRRRVRL
jgi:hypothetical protein